MKYTLIGLLLILFSLTSFSQKGNNDSSFDVDSNYIKSYYNDLIIRFVSVNKNNFLQFKDLEQGMRLRYRPNDYFNLGIGVNYKWFGLNIGTKIPCFSDDDDRYGTTTNFGLQSYLYGRKFTIDVMAQRKKGYYLSLSDYHDLTEGDPIIYYQRHDIETLNIGAGFTYVLNHRRFSYKAAFKQNELQKKNAGSVILGAGIYMLEVNANLAFVPREIDDEYFVGWRNFDNFQNYTANASAGYAYSFVPHKNWIISGSYKFNFGVHQNIWQYDGESDDWQAKLSWGNEFRLSGGHHFPKFYIGASFVRYEQHTPMKISSLSLKNGTNYAEFTISKRIDL